MRTAALLAALWAAAGPAAAFDWYAGDGSDGVRIVTGNPDNEDAVKTNISAAVAAGGFSIQVAASAGFAVGDLVLVIQMTGAGAGNHEFRRLSGTTGGPDSLIVSKGLTNGYGATGAQVIKVKEYSAVTVANGGVWSASAWNGTTGGVLAAVVRGSVTVAAGGFINVSAAGFRGAQASVNSGGRQGEGETGAAFPTGFSMSANGSGGGGGQGMGSCSGDAAGGGGGGHGVGGTAGGAFNSGAGGGTTGSPSLSAALFMGGGGGAGGSNTGVTSPGGDGGFGGRGGGVVFVVAAGAIAGGGGVSANGASGGMGANGNPGACKTAGGGGGAGGSIRLVSSATVALSGTVVALAGGGGTAANGGLGSGGVGGAGRIAVLKVSTPSLTTTPAFDASSGDGVTEDDPFTAPGSVTDLKVSTVIGGGLDTTSVYVRLTWTAPGADGSSTTLNGSTFTLRWANSPITSNALFDSAGNSVDIATSGVVPGSLQSRVIGPLDPTLAAYFAVKTTDAWGMTSGLSVGATAAAVQTALAATAQNTYDVGWADFDLDGDLDAFTANRAGENAQRLTQTAGDFSAAGIAAGLDGTGLAWGDFDKDGDPDLLVGNGFSGAAETKLLVNLGAGSFLTTNMPGSMLQTLGAAWADLDNDGDLDGVLANDGANMRILRNGPSGFTAVDVAGTSHRNIAVVAGDFDGDGRVDLAVATENSGTGDDYVLYNDGGMSFTKSFLSGSNSFGRGIAAGDVDGDGDLDLVLSYTAGNNEMVFLNNGNRSFASPVAYATGGNSERVQVGDYDNDGDLDAVVTNIEGTNNKLLRNAGNGTFTVFDLAKGGTVRSRGASFGDYDADGDLDILLGNDNAEPEYLVRNDTGTPNAVPVPPGPDQHAVMFSYSPAGSTMTFAWLAGSFDGAAATTSLHYDVAVSTFPLDLTAGATGFLPTVNSFVVPPSHPIPGFGHLGRPGYQDWTGEGFPFHAVLLSTRGAAAGSPLQWNATYYMRLQTIDAGLARSTWGAQKEFYLPDPCAENHSRQSGRWADANTWATGLVPLACTPVRVQAGHTVKVDITTATASTTTVLGSLVFSNTAHSSLTLVGGSLYVQAGGLLEMGGPAVGGAVPAAVKAHLVLAHGSSAGQFGLVVQPGGNLRVQGASGKSPFGFATESIPAGQGFFKISASSAVGWEIDDVLVVGHPGLVGASPVEQRRITAISGTDPLTVTLHATLSARTVTSTSVVAVANLTRNVLIRSSGTNVNTNSAYLWALPTHTTGFIVEGGEFAYLGSGTAGLWEKSGVYLATGTKPSLSSSTFHHGWYGLAFDGAGSTVTAGVAAMNLSRGVAFTNYAHGSLSSATIAIGNQNTGFETAASTRHALVNVVSVNNSVHGADMDGGTRLESGVLIANSFDGVNVQANFQQAGAAVVRASLLGRNGQDGVEVAGGRAVLEGNRAYNNAGNGFGLAGAGSQVLSSTAAFNASHGFRMTGGPHLAAGNAAFSNSQSGFYAEASSSVFVENFSYSNTRLGFDVATGSPTWAGGALGRDRALLPAANAAGGVGADTAVPGKNMRLLDAWLNGGIALSNLAFAGDSFLSYAQDRATGTVRVLGDLAVDRSTLTLDYAQFSRRASTTNAVVLRGAGHSLTVQTLSDADAVSQVVTVEFRGGQWHMDGSVSGPDMRTWIGNEIGGSYPAVTPQFTFDFLQGGVQTEGDRVSFAVLASGKDTGVQKRLLFENTNGAFNAGKSRLRVSPGGGLELRGADGFPTVVDRLNGSSTYYTLVASGSFTAERSSITNMDGDGLQLFIADGQTVRLATTTFDSMGVATATGSYITVGSLTALAPQATFYGLAFGDSRSTAALAAAYNIRAVGIGPFPRWTLRRWTGFMGGEGRDGELSGDDFQWSPFRPDLAVSSFSARTTHTVTVHWAQGANDEGAIYEVQANTYPFANGAFRATFTSSGLSAPVDGLEANTSYYWRVFAAQRVGPSEWDLEFSPELDLGLAATLPSAATTLAEGMLLVAETSATLAWGALPVAPSSVSSFGYALEASSTGFDGTGVVYSSVTDNVLLSTLTLGVPPQPPLERNTTYYFRVGSRGPFDDRNYTALGASATLAALATPNFTGVFVTSVTASWPGLPASPQSARVEGFRLEASTTNFGADSPGGAVLTSASAVGALTSLTMTGLTPYTTYFMRLASLNVGGTPNYTASGSTVPVLFARAVVGAASNSRGAAWADIDGDGDLDAVVANVGGENNAWLRNDGGNAFTPFSVAGGGADGQGVAWGDYDNDGDLDALVANSGLGVDETLLRNDGGTLTSVTVSGSAGDSYGVAWADFDGDGDLDAVVANGGTDSEVLLRNDGGALVAQIIPGTAGDSRAAAAGDYDGDGDVDVLVATTGGGDEVLLRNDGNLSFSPQSLTGTGGDSVGVAWGDYDGDGDLDAVVANSGTQDEFLLRNDGGGAFAKVVVVGSAGDSRGVVWGDHDNDGDLDALVANANGEPEVLLRNDAGTLAAVRLTATGGHSFGLSWGDSDGDGDLDALVANASAESESLLRNDGSYPNAAPAAPAAGFTAAFREFSPFSSSGTLTVGWGDASDAATPAGLMRYRVRVGTTVPGSSTLMKVPPPFSLDGAAGGSWGPHATRWGGGNRLKLALPKEATVYWAVTAEDLVGARSAESAEQSAGLVAPRAVTDLQVYAAAATGFGASTMSVTLTWTAPGADGTDGTLSGVYDLRWSSTTPLASTGAFVAAAYSVQVVTAGVAPGASVYYTVPDLAIDATWSFALAALDAQTYPEGVRSGLSNPATGYGYLQSIPTGGDSIGAAWGDFDADGDPDALVANSNPTPHEVLIINDGGGRFSSATIPSGEVSGDVAWGDYDNDGDLDALVTNASGGIQKLLRNDAGSFSVVSVTGTSGAHGRQAGWADYDGDGDLDAAVSNGGGGAWLLRNDGGELTALTLPSPNSNGSAWGDYDGDGDPDLVVVGAAASETLFVNEGGTFTAVDIGERGTGRAAWGDYDADGDLDLFVGPSTLLNNAGGALTPVIIPAVSGSVGAWGDFDGDGDLDLAVSANPVVVLRNDGAGVFTKLVLAGTAGLQVAAVAAADHDGDGDLDLLLARGNGTSQTLDELLAWNPSDQPNPAPSAPAPQAADLHLVYDQQGATLTVRWDPGSDGAADTDTLGYRLALATVPMTASGDGLRLTAGGPFAVPWAAGNEGTGSNLRPAFRLWPGGGAPQHGRSLRLGSAGGALPNDATYYIRLQAVDAGHRPSPWSVELSTFVFAAVAPAGRLVTAHASSMTVVYSTVAGGAAYFAQAYADAAYSVFVASDGTTDLSRTSVTVAGLAANTTYFLRMGVLYERTTAYAATLPASTATYAAPPGAAAAGAEFPLVWEASAAVRWTRGGNPVDITTYTVSLSTGLSWPNAFSGNRLLSTAPAGADPMAAVDGLAANTTYYARVWAVGHGGAETSYVFAGATATLLETPSGFYFQALSSWSVLAVASAPGGAFTNLDSSASAVNVAVGGIYQGFVELSSAALITGLLPNNAYDFKARSRNRAGVEGPESAVFSTFTLAAVPSTATPTFLAVHASSALAAWTHNGNPTPATEFRLHASTASDFNVAASSRLSGWTTQLSTYAAGLTAHATWYLRVQARNAHGVETAFTELGSTVPARYAVVPVPVSGGFSKASWGDYDGDGDLDAVFSNHGAAPRVLRNDGAGGFTDIVLPGVSSNVQAAWADVDGDGDLDILLANISGENEILWRNDGGTFTGESIASGGTSRAVVWGDFDGDGDPDAVVANQSGTDLVYLKNDGGTLAPRPLAGTDGNYWGLTAADFDADGDLDFVAAGLSGTTALGRNNGDGTFAVSAVVAQSAYDAQAVDADADGDADVYLSRGSFGDGTLLVNDGAGNFAPVAVPGAQPGDDEHGAWADADGDGDLDGLFPAAGGTAFLLRNQGAGAFAREELPGTTANGIGVAWGDYDGDGDPDGLLGVNGGPRLLLRDDGDLRNSSPTAPGAAAFHLAYEARSATLTVTWAAGAFDAESSTALLNYALAVATAPMTLSPDGLRVVSPSSFVVSWNYGSPLTGDRQRAPYKVWPGEASPRHGLKFRMDAEGLVGANFKSDATYYFRLAAVDSGLARGSWSVESSTFLYRGVPPGGRALAAVSTHSLSVSYSTTSAAAHLVQASTAADFTGAGGLVSSGDPSVALATVEALAPNTTYFVRLGTLWQRTTEWAFAVPASTATDPAVPAAAVSTFPKVDSASMTVVWSAAGNPLGVTTYTVVLATSNFYPTSGTMTVVATTAPAAGPAATVFGLKDLTTYYLFVRAEGHSGTASAYAALGSTVTGADFEPPGAVTDLRVASAALAGRFVDLEWSAPGDDGYFNPLDSGEFRVDYATYAAVFSTAGAEVFQATTAVAPGARQYLRVSALEGQATYYFRVFARDDGGLWSPLSNGATVHLAWSAETLSAGGRTVSAVALRDGSLNLLYQSGANLAHLRRSAAGVWSGPFTAGVGNGAGAEFSAAAGDAQGRIHAVYADGASLQDVKYAVWDGVWGAPETVFAGAGAFTWSVSVAVDAAGGVHAAWNNTASSPHVRYSSRPAGGSWSAPTGLSDSGNNRKVDLRLDADGRAVVAYTNSAGRLRVSRWEGAAFAASAVDDAVSVDGPAAFALGLDGRAAFVLKAFGTNAVEVVTGTVAGAWTSAGADLLATNSVLYPALLIDGAGGARALYHQSEAAQSQTGSGDLRLAAHDGSAWRPAVVDRAGGGGSNSQYPGLAVDAAGVLHAGYIDGSGGPVRHASFTAHALPVPGEVSPPDAFRADAVHQTSVTWAWTDSHPSELGYRVYGGTAAPFGLRAGTDTLAAGAQSFAETGLTPNATYFRYAAVVTAGGAGVSVGVTTVTRPVEPVSAASTWTAVSTGVLAAAWETGGNAAGTRYEAVLSTGPLPNSHSGNVVVATAPQGAPGAVFAGLAADTTHYLMARAVGHAWAPTAYVPLGSTHTAPGMPGASTAPFAAVWQTSVTVQWSSGVNPVWTEYRVELATSADFGGTLSANGWEAFPSTTLAGLTRDTTYWARVTARGLSGALSAPLSLGATVTLAAPPGSAGAPFPLVAVSALRAAWDGAGNPADTLYQAVVSTENAVPDGGADETLVATRSVGGADFSGLQANSTHTLFVRAVNRGGTPTAWAALDSTATLAAPPGAAAATFTAVGQTSMTLSWSAGLNPAGTLYLARASTSTSLDGSADLLSGLLPGFTTGFIGLLPDTTYFFRVAARGHSGQFSALHDPGAKATLAYEPAASTEPFHAVWVTSATVQWQGGGNPATTLYQAEASTAADFSGTVLASGWAASLSTTVTGLVGDSTYTWRVRARGVGGDLTAPLAPGSTVTLAADPALLLRAVGPTALTLAWGSAGNREAESAGAWSAATALPAARERHGAVLEGGRVYVVGGLVSGAPSAEVWSAPAYPGGALGAWRREADLPAAREAAAVAAHRGVLYAVGGFEGSARATVYSAVLSTSGAAASWSPETSLPAARTKLAAVAEAGWLYALGGDNGVVSQASVYRAPLAEDGRVGSWAAATALPAARNSHAAAVAGGRVYVAGGLGAGVEEEVWSAPLSGGSVGPWRTETALPAPVFRHALAASGGALVLLGGHDGTAAAAGVLSAPLAAGGELGAWSALTPLPAARHGAAAVLSDSDLYALGGSDDAAAQPSAYAAALAGTEYLVETAQDAGFAVQYASSGWRAGAGAVVGGLTPNTVYHARVRSRTRAGLAGPASVSVSTRTPAAMPGASASTFSLVEAGSATLSWASGGNPAGTEFLAALSTAMDFTNALMTGWGTAVSSTVWGLSPNATYFAAVIARDADQRETRELFLGSTVTAAAVPGTPAFPSVLTTGLTVEWSTAANPAGTRYEVQLATSAAFSPLAGSSVTLSSGVSFSGLLSATTYHLRARAFNWAGTPSAFSAPASTVTGGDLVAPSSAAALALHPSETAGVLLAVWTAPGDDGDAGALPAGSRFYLQWSLTEPSGVAWSTANAQLSASTGPVNAGAAASLLVTGLTADATVYARVWTLDESGNVSLPSDPAAAWASPFTLSRLDGTGTDAGAAASVALDRSGDAHAVYTAGTLAQELRYRKRTGGVWSVAEAPDPGVPAEDAVVAVDGAGVPSILYRNSSTGQLRLARRGGAWTASAVASGDLRPGGLVLDATGYAHVAYYDASATALRYARWDGAAWVVETADSGGDVGRHASLALAADQTPHLAYLDSGNADLKHASRTAAGAWLASTVDGAATVGSSPSVVLDGDGRPAVFYLDAGTRNLKLARFDGAAWALSVVDTGTASGVGGAALDGAGRAVVSYFDGASGDLRLARQSGGGWRVGVLDGYGAVGGWSSPAVEADGGLLVLHHDAQAGDLKAAAWSGAGLTRPLGGNARGRAQAPSAFSGVAASSTVIQWTWVDSVEGELGWRLYGALTATGPFTLVASTTALPGTAGTGNQRIYTESGLAEGTTYFRYAAAVAPGGVVVGPMASLYPYTTVDSVVPVISDNQADDPAWRRSTGTLYNVDFTDSGGSALSRFQVKASTVPGGAGPDLVAYTDVVTNILADSYSADWALPASVFAAMLDGATNYVTVRVEDGNANAAVKVDAFAVLKDTTPPGFADNQGDDPTRRAAGGTAYDVDALDAASGLERFQYSVSTTALSGDGAAVAWTDIALPDGATFYRTDWSLAFAGLIGDATNYVSVRAWDRAGSTATALDAFSVVKDTGGPLLSLLAPSATFHSVLTVLSGTAADAAGVASVSVAVQESPPGGVWFDGAAFTAGAPVWLAASGTAGWSRAAPAFTDGVSYRVAARGTDSLGNLSVTNSTADFTMDRSTPTAAVTVPADGATLAVLPNLSGTANDPGAAPSGLLAVEVQVRRVSDGLYWNWAAGAWGVAALSTSPALGSPWTLPVPAALRASLAHGATYFVSARAADNAVPANVGTFAVGSSFTWTDTTAPAAVTDLTASSGSAPGDLHLSWTAPGDDGADGVIGLGQFRVHYATYPAAAFSTAAAQVAFSTAGVTPGVRQGRLVGGLGAGTTYYAVLFTADDAGNWSPLSNAATAYAGVQPFSHIKGFVRKSSSEPVTAVLVEAYNASDQLVSSAFSVADGSGSFTLAGVPDGVFRVQAAWTADEVTSSVWLDNIAVGTTEVTFMLEVSYTLSTLTGTLASLSAQAASPTGFLAKAAEDGFSASSVELMRGGRTVAQVRPDPTGRWTIPNLLPGKYAVRAYNGLDYTDPQDVQLGEGETKEVVFVFDPLPEASVFAFPNPARSGTTFRFVSALPGLEAQVTVFDIAGVAVKEIPGSAFVAKPGGVHHAAWDLTNDRGEAVASGVYLFMTKVKGSNGQTGKVVKKIAVVR